MKKNATTHAGSELIEQTSVTADVIEEEPTDWARVLAMTPEEVMEAARSDPDAQPMTREQLARMRRFPDPVRIRDDLNQMTQQRFSRLFQIPLGTLRDWEQKAHFPDGAAIALLRIIERDPLAAALALNPELKEAEIAPELGLLQSAAPTT
ncbi:MAG: hypothetical protein M3Z20_15070 [Chloroflexota bacterium]|nr:hypothetical protein [Chloroflexota bacterium]